MLYTFSAIYKTAAILLIVAGSFASCKKLVDIPDNPPTKIEESLLFSDSASAMTAVAAVYSYAAYGDGVFSFKDGAVTIYSGLYADELIANSTDPTFVEFNVSNLRTENYSVGTLWNAPYSGLYTVNSVIARVSASTGLSETFKKQILGEMKVMRALYYFHLVNQFGAVPLVTTQDYKLNALLERSSVDSVYALIISDLTDAVNALPTTYPSAGHARPNLYTAMAFLAKVHLYREQWQAAFDATSTIINSNTYSLEPDLNNVFLTGSNEALWQLPANIPNSNFAVAEAISFIPYASGVIPTLSLRDALLSAFEPNDQRKVSWTQSTDVNINGSNQTYTYPYKYKNRNYSNPTVEDYMIFRLGEIYLIHAEAAAHIGNMSTAIADVDTVRTRAGLPPTTASPSNSQEVFDAIAHERQTELFCEWGNRLFDLKRTGKASAVLGAIKADWQPFREVYPIPEAQRKLNFRLTQNEGYTN